MPTLLNRRNGTRLRFEYVARPPGCGEHTGQYMAPNGRACWDCQSFMGLSTEGMALCEHPGCSPANVLPWIGCCSWQREPRAGGFAGPPAVALKLIRAESR